jgi:hypothetical protein
MATFFSVLKAVASVVLVIGPTIYFGVMAQTEEMAIAVVGGGIAAGFLNLGRLKSFKGGGFEAQMREAEETISSLRSIARPLLVATIDTVTMAGRIGGMKGLRKHELFADLSRTAVELGIADHREIANASKKFFQYHCWDHYARFVRAMRTDSEWSAEVKDRLAEYIDFHSTDHPTEEAVRAILAGDGRKLGNDHEQRLMDYVYYLRNSKMRTPESLD